MDVSPSKGAAVAAIKEDVMGEYSDTIEQISDIVDRYWNGSKSLLSNYPFRSK